MKLDPVNLSDQPYLLLSSGLGMRRSLKALCEQPCLTLKNHPHLYTRELEGSLTRSSTLQGGSVAGTGTGLSPTSGAVQQKPFPFVTKLV